MAEPKTRSMMPVIPILLPHRPAFPVIKKPEWKSPPPDLFHLRSGQAITLSDVSFRDRYGSLWTVPMGYPTDGMSYPWLLRRLGWDRFDRRTIRTAVVHDFRYSMHDYIQGWHLYDTQKNADLGLLDGLRLEFPSRAVTCYIGVRFGGFCVYEHISYEFLMVKWLRAVRDGQLALEKYMREVTQLPRFISG